MKDGNVGHNNPPDPIEEVIAEYGGVITEAQNWTDGALVENESQMEAVDVLLKQFKSYKSALNKAGKLRTDPLHKAWKSEVASVKIYTDDADRIQKALVACVAPFKEKLAEEKRAAERAAWEEADRKRREAEALAAKANEADLEQQRDAAAAIEQAKIAEIEAKKASKDKVKGRRTVQKYEIENEVHALHWIARNDKPAIRAFIGEYVRRYFKTTAIDGVRVWSEKEAF